MKGKILETEKKERKINKYLNRNGPCSGGVSWWFVIGF